MSSLTNSFGVFGTVINVIIMVVVGGAIPVTGVVLGILYLLYYNAPEDQGFKVAVFPKVIFIIAFSLAVIGILLMPYSVASERLDLPDGWDLYLMLVYQIFYSVVVVVIVVVVPFTICYYESQDPDSKTILPQIKWGCIYSICVTVIFVIVLIIFWAFLGKANIQYVGYFVDSSVAQNSEATAFNLESTACGDSCLSQSSSFTVTVSLFIYIVALVAIIGYFLFIVCGGIGITVLPVGCICSFIRRPKSITTAQYAKMKRTIMEKTKKLIELGEKIKDEMSLGKFNSPKDRILFGQFKEEVYQCEVQMKIAKLGHRANGAPVIRYYFQLAIGILLAFFSVLWILHIILYLMLKDIVNWSFGFMNIMLTFLDDWIFPAGTIIYLLLVCHLIFCILAGFSQVASRIPLISIHPLEKRNTMMSSMLFNVGLFLLSSVSVNQFAADSFSDFARNSVLDLMFGGCLRNLMFFEYFYKYVFVFGFLIMAAIGFVIGLLLYIWPRRSKEEKDIQKLINKLV